MISGKSSAMRDVMISAIYEKMQTDKDIYFLSADMGAPTLDILREDFPDRFINVGIAEQNLINVASGLAQEGCKVFTYAIAPFYFRAYEQIRINLAIPAQLKAFNVNMLAVGVGISYDFSGPTHHCLDDISAMKAMPNVMTICPCDGVSARGLVDFSLETDRPKYIRLDGKPQPDLYHNLEKIDFKTGFSEVKKGTDICIVATGVMVHVALAIRKQFGNRIGVVDVSLLDTLDVKKFSDILKEYRQVISLEEGFIGIGGLDATCALAITEYKIDCNLKRFGMRQKFEFTPRDRETHHSLNGCGAEDVAGYINSIMGD